MRASNDSKLEKRLANERNKKCFELINNVNRVGIKLDPNNSGKMEVGELDPRLLGNRSGNRFGSKLGNKWGNTWG
jgi:hypothetical protein